MVLCGRAEYWLSRGEKIEDAAGHKVCYGSNRFVKLKISGLCPSVSTVEIRRLHVFDPSMSEIAMLRQIIARHGCGSCGSAAESISVRRTQPSRIDDALNQTITFEVS
jgi:hypothetical protein